MAKRFTYVQQNLHTGSLEPSKETLSPYQAGRRNAYLRRTGAAVRWIREDYLNVGRIELPKGETANERAKRVTDYGPSLATAFPTVEYLAAKFQAVIAKNNYSPKIAAIIGAVLGFDYGVRDGRGNQVTGLSITSDGFVIGQTPNPDASPFIGSADDLARNLALLIADANLTLAETKLYGRLYDTHVKDWRS